MSRSQPGADRQAGDLRAAGYEVVVSPVITIEPLSASPPPGVFDDVVFLSEQAVRLGFLELQALAWFAHAQVLAVGARTREVLRARGVDAEAPAEPTSEGLLAMPGLGLPGRRVLLVSGVGGRGVLAPELAARGAIVARFDCYRRVPCSGLGADVLTCGAVIAASAEGLRQVAQSWLAAGGRADVPVLVPSARVAALGVEVGLSNLHDCAGAGSDAWLRGLAHVQSSGAA